MTNTTTTNATPFRFPSVPAQVARRALPSPPVRRVIVNGSPAVAISLVGRAGSGWEVLMDEPDLERVRAVAGSRFIFDGSDPAVSYVVTTSRAAAEMMRGAPVRGPVQTNIARLTLHLAGENLTDKAVVVRDGLRLNLTRRNLLVISRGLCGCYRPDMPRPVVELAA